MMWQFWGCSVCGMTRTDFAATGQTLLAVKAASESPTWQTHAKLHCLMMMDLAIRVYKTKILIQTSTEQILSRKDSAVQLDEGASYGKRCHPDAVHPPSRSARSAGSKMSIILLSDASHQGG